MFGLGLHSVWIAMMLVLSYYTDFASSTNIAMVMPNEHVWHET